jgi:hypothetical protein
MNPSPAAITWIRTFGSTVSGGWASNTDAEVVTAANTPSTTNPVAQATVAKPYTVSGLLGLLSQASLVNVYEFPAVHDLFVDIEGQSTAAVLDAVSLLLGSGKILSSEATALNAALLATQIDPSWTSQISAAQANLGRNIDTYDSAAARAS